MNNCDKCTCMLDDEFDRISSLPDEMLQHILSLLGIRKAVQMSLVSKRWVSLWTSLSRLNFDPHEFVSKDEYCDSTEDRKRAHDAKFKEFVDTLLSCREASFLDTFQIKILDQDDCSDLVRTCVSNAMKFNPRVFSMKASFLCKDICGPIFSCESIDELYLRNSFVFFQGIPDVVNLPRIRRLQLTHNRLDNRSITRLFSGCPVLENVSLKYCHGEYSCIFSQKLKYLSLRRCIFQHSNRVIHVHSCLLGDAINLVIIRSHPFLVDFIWKSLGTTAAGNTFSFMQNIFRYLDFGDYIGGLSDVTFLEFRIKVMNYISEAAVPKLGEFHNLKDLCLGSWCMTCNFSTVTFFLQQTPNLQKITLNISARGCRGKETSIHQMRIRIRKKQNYLISCPTAKKLWHSGRSSLSLRSPMLCTRHGRVRGGGGFWGQETGEMETEKYEY
ncbi:putative F-box/LRR-repeat protein At3g58880 [Carex rostrata]